MTNQKERAELVKRLEAATPEAVEAAWAHALKKHGNHPELTWLRLDAMDDFVAGWFAGKEKDQ